MSVEDVMRQISGVLLIGNPQHVVELYNDIFVRKIEFVDGKYQYIN